MKKLIFLMFLAIGITGCSVESVDSTDNIVTADAKFKMQEAQDPMGFYAGNSGNLKGTLAVWNDCDNLYIEISPSGDAPEDAELGLFTSLPEINNGGNLSGNLEFNLNDATDLKWTISLSTLDTDAQLLVFAKAWGDWAGDQGHGKTNYLTYNINTADCGEVELNCKSGYMLGELNFDEVSNSSNWGWAHQFNFDGTGSETREIHHKNGSLEGTVTVSYDNGLITIEEGDGVSISHLYISNDKPETNAPGQFDKEQKFEDADGNFWVMIKADVCN